MKWIREYLPWIMVTAILGTFIYSAVQPFGEPVDIDIYENGGLPADARLAPLKDLNGHFPFVVPKNKATWETRATELKRQIQVATGLWPMPEKTALAPVIHGRLERDGITIEKVYFQSLPGHYVTGLLFRPKNAEGKHPAVLSPHGHGGRKFKSTDSQIRKMIAEGQERFLESGRYPKVSRCVHLARMGCVVLLYDMLGYGDSQQIDLDTAHRFERARPDLENNKRWGLFTTQAELRLQSIMGLQTWNSIRALDFLESLPDVDPKRIAVTGGSGGGTQTILLCALDDRPIAAFPQGMVSTSMQGGCVCENCSLLRVDTGNVELAALFAPKPQAMTAADDWTKDMMVDGYPELQQLYAMVGDKENVFCKSFPNFPHNYNYVSRALMYQWFNKHLKLGLEDPVLEDDYPPLSDEEHSVWSDKHTAPPGGLQYELDLMQQLTQRDQKQFEDLLPQNTQQWIRFGEVVNGAWSAIFGSGPNPNDLERIPKKEKIYSNFTITKEVIRNHRLKHEVPVVRLVPHQAKGQLVLWITGIGKDGLLDSRKQILPEVSQLLQNGFTVIAADLFQQGEFLADGPLTQTRTVETKSEFAGYTFGYNRSVLAWRVHDVQSILYLLQIESPTKIDIIGTPDAAAITAAVLASGHPHLRNAAMMSHGFRFEHLKSYRDPNFLPGAVKYGDVPGMLLSATNRSVWVGGEESEVWQPLIKRMESKPVANRMHISDKNATLAQAVQWLISTGETE